MIHVSDQPKPEWAKLPRPGCENVQFRLLLSRDGISVANLRFASTATIDPHSAPFDIDVICVQGAGFTSVAEVTQPINAGQTVRWPKDEVHCLWTDGQTMETIMIERHG